MEIDRQATGVEIRVVLAGEVTLAGAQRLQAELRECLAGESRVVMDLRHVTGIDLAGLQVLAAAARSLAARQRRLVILRGDCVARAIVEAGYPPEEVLSGEDNHDGG